MSVCKICIYYKSKDVCIKRHIRVSQNTQSCNYFDDKQQKVEDTQICATCKHHYFPDKEYKNYNLYLDCNGKFFLCKCRLSKWAKFVNKEKCQKWEHTHS